MFFPRAPAGVPASASPLPVVQRRALPLAASAQVHHWDPSPLAGLLLLGVAACGAVFAHCLLCDYRYLPLFEAILRWSLAPFALRWPSATTRGVAARGRVPSAVLALATIAQPARSTAAFYCASYTRCRTSSVLHLRHHHLPARVALH